MDEELPIAEVPPNLTDHSPAGMKSLLMDVFVQFGKIDPAKMGFADGMAMAVAYGSLSSIVNMASKRQQKA